MINPQKPSKRFDEWETPKIIHGKITEYNFLVLHPIKLDLAKYVDIAAFTFINAYCGVKIEKDVQIGPFTAILSASTIDSKFDSVVIKEGACIGSHTTIMPGVTIGENTIIGVNSFVNKDIPNDCLAFGTPIEIIENYDN